MMLLKFLDTVKWFGARKLYYSIQHLFNLGFDSLVPVHQQTLIKKPISRTLVKYYDGDDGQQVNFTQFFLGFGLIHYAFIRNLKPTRILCVGSRKGYIPAILALACKDNAKGHVDFVDAGYDLDEPTKHWSGIGFWKVTNTQQHFSKIGVQNYITTHVMTTKAYAQKFTKKRYQYIYIDGDHSYEGVKLDYKLFWPKLDRGGFMVFHDVSAQGYLDGGAFGVHKFWKELSNKHTLTFPFPKQSGLGILQK